ncbi:MAG: UDP-N-acetylmuramoyl-tripeptide--D-alanyl-D-alanine ligase, partial [Pseudomonadota bacterium]
MDMMLSQIADVVNGEIRGADVSITAAAIDSRRVAPGDLFVALDGERVRGIDYVDSALDNGAAAALIAEPLSDTLSSVVVKDPLQALQTMSAYWRSKVDAVVIAVTGSNGKTTMRSMIAACLGDASFATEGNYNNHIGVPMMLTRLDRSHRRAVLELGANHHGEIAEMAAWVKPDIAIITNAGPAHLEGFGSIEGVAHAKGELFESLDENGIAVINADDPYAPLWHDLAAPASTVSFGSTSHADYWYSELETSPNGVRFKLHVPGDEAEVHLALDGDHNALNAVGAAAVTHSAGISLGDIVDGLASVAPEPGRQDPLRALNGATVFDDSYNANPASMHAAAKMLAASYAKPWMVIGDMGELGADSETMHFETGAAIREAGVARLFAFGPMSAYAAEGFGDGAQH